MGPAATWSIWQSWTFSKADQIHELGFPLAPSVLETVMPHSLITSHRVSLYGRHVVQSHAIPSIELRQPPSDGIRSVAIA